MRTPFRLDRLVCEPIELELSTPLVTSAGSVHARKLLMIRAEVTFYGTGAATTGATTSVRGFGEAAPLPGWSRETLDDCAEFVGSLDAERDFDSVGRLDEVFPGLGRLPSLRFGVELALLDAVARHVGEPLRELLAGPDVPALDAVPVQYTLGATSVEQTVTAARTALAAGYECIKIKVGKQAPGEDIERIRQLHGAVPDAALRLDANGAWTLSEALSVARSLAGCGVDLIEQPVARDDITALVELAEKSPVDIAADESCVPTSRARRLIDARQVDAVVLKPSALGGLLPAAELAKLARERGVRVVWSTLLESAVGRSAVTQLAASLPELNGPHGLATGPWFAADTAPDEDRLSGGRLVLRDGPGLGFEPQFAPRRETF